MSPRQLPERLLDFTAQPLIQPIRSNQSSNTMTRIIQITDLHVLQEADARLKGVPVRYFLERVIDHILEHQPGCDAMVITGDHTHDELETSYRYLHQLLTPWRDRLYQVPGNHDDRDVLRTVFADCLQPNEHGFIEFSFAADGWHCLGLDTHYPGEVSGMLTEAQIRRARCTAEESGQPRIAVFCHHPPVPMQSVWMDSIGLSGAEFLTDWCHSDPRVQLVCCGHVHHESEHRVGEAAVLTTPSTGVQFSPEGDVPNFVADYPGYRVIELTPAGASTRVCRISELSIPEG